MQYHVDIMSNKPLWLSGTKKNLFWVNCIPFVFLSKLFRYNYVFVVKSNSKLHTLPMWAFNWSVIKAGLLIQWNSHFLQHRQSTKTVILGHTDPLWKGLGWGVGNFLARLRVTWKIVVNWVGTIFFKNSRFNNPSPGWVKRLNPKVVKLRPSHTHWKNLFPRR